MVDNELKFWGFFLENHLIAGNDRLMTQFWPKSLQQIPIKELIWETHKTFLIFN